jgi:hypothetical protein
MLVRSGHGEGDSAKWIPGSEESTRAMPSKNLFLSQKVWEG